MWTEKQIKEEVKKSRKRCLEELEILRDCFDAGVKKATKNGVLNERRKDAGFNMLDLGEIDSSMTMLQYYMRNISRYNKILGVVDNVD